MEEEEVSIHTNSNEKKHLESQIEDAYGESLPKESEGAPAESNGDGQIDEHIEGTARGSQTKSKAATDSD